MAFLLAFSLAAIGTYDVVVYDASAGGVIAAVAAARHGSSVALLCASWPSCFEAGGMRIGGMSSGGLGETDYGGCSSKIGGFAREFYRRNRERYTLVRSDVTAGASGCRLPAAGCNETFNLEPHAALEIFEAMVKEAGVALFFGTQVHSVAFASNAALSITSITVVDGRTFAGSIWIDASYEGDLMAHAGVQYTSGRESRALYGESLAGRRTGGEANQMDRVVDPYDALGRTLPFVSAQRSPAPSGGGDNRTQAYNFRLCLTNDASNRVAWSPPSNYNATEWSALTRYLEACSTNPGCQMGYPSCNMGALPGHKVDANNCGGFSTDLIGGSNGYAEASYDGRVAIWNAHLAYTKGLMWTMANSSIAAVKVRVILSVSVRRAPLFPFFLSFSSPFEIKRLLSRECLCLFPPARSRTHTSPPPPPA